MLGRVLAVLECVLAVLGHVLVCFPVVFGSRLVVLAEYVLTVLARSLAKLGHVLLALTAGLGSVLGWLVVPGHVFVGRVECGLAGTIFIWAELGHTQKKLVEVLNDGE